MDLNWNDEQAMQRRVASNCLYNCAMGKMKGLCSEQQGEDLNKSARKRKSMRFAEEIEVEVRFQTNQSTWDQCIGLILIILRFLDNFRLSVQQAAASRFNDCTTCNLFREVVSDI